MTEEYGKVQKFIQNSYFRTGFLKLSDFEIAFVDYQSVISSFNLTPDLFDKMLYNIKSIEVPAFTIEIDEMPYRQRLVKRTLGDITTVFYESADSEIRRNMYKWINGIIEDDSDIMNYKRKYFDDCVVNLNVKQILPTGYLASNTQWEYFKDVYPVSVSALSLDQTTENDVGTVTIQWKYKHHSIGT